ncbi:MAG: imidazole glycerol phosphate synthase subunit HisH [Alphaproteobacteria bacterium]|nr:imidazole glycerol phosphate synthase subunit HisH [Pseudomonadota bacterium]
MSVAIVDYGSGNLRSAAKAFERAAGESGLGPAIEVTDDAKRLSRASHIVLPGVGAFADCKRGLTALPGMWEALNREVIDNAKPFLGICVGMQLMATRGLEHGAEDGLAWIAGEVAPIEPKGSDLKVPHMGWNDLAFEGGHALLAGISPGEHAYFVHSYHFVCGRAAERVAWVDYGGRLAAMVARDNIAGTQFHPEKSQRTGLKLISNFLRWRP